MSIQEKYVRGTILRTVVAMTIAYAALQPSAALAQANATTATLTGVVLDEAGGAIPDVRVTLVNLENGLQRATTTAAEGQFVLPLPPGRYTVTAQRDGFTPAEVPDVVLTVNEPIALRILLKVAAITEAVVVTAQKRGEERLTEVPVPVAVLKGETLVSSNHLLLRDYYATVPGLSLSAETTYQQQRLSIRGITTGSSSPTVGVTVDDMPFGASTDWGGGVSVPDFDPGDLAQIEILRGPQGTLHGANSMGGLIRYVTTDPTVAGISGRVEAGTSSVHNGAQAGGNIRASLNLPMGKAFAIRVSGFTRQDAGYIDNPIAQRKGVNRARTDGARLSALWRPSENLSLKLGAIYQHTEGDGLGEVEVEPGLGDLQQNYLPGLGGYERTVQAYSAVLKGKLRGVDLTSVSGYSIHGVRTVFDRSFQWGAAVQTAFGVAGAPYYLSRPNNRKFTQELRVGAPVGKRVEWHAGVFFADESGPYTATGMARDTTTRQNIGVFLEFYSPRDYSEYALFGGLTYRLTDRLDVQLGERVSRNELIVAEYAFIGPYAPLLLNTPSPAVNPRLESKTSAVTYLVTPRFRMTPTLMIYGRLASGYRPGGVNTVGPSLPLEYQSDSTRNYEVGFKGEFLDQRLSIDTSLYYIDWTDIQLNARQPGSGLVYTTNGSGAKSEGVEISASATPIARLTLSGWMAYNNAVLTELFPPGPSYGAPGDRLPNTPRASGYLSAQQGFDLWRGTTGFVGAATSYVGDRVGIFLGTANRQSLPAYTTADVHGGVKYASWALNVFLNNVTDERGVINGGLGYLPPNAFVYIQPRTFGVSIARTF